MPRFDPTAFPPDTQKDIRRTISIDANGNAYSSSNPMPIAVEFRDLTQSYINESVLVATTATLTVGFTAKLIEICNDSETDSLQYKFESGDTYSTLLAGEKFTIPYSAESIYLSSTASVAYRVRAYA